MPWPVHPTGFFGARGDQDTYRIERSLRFNSADSAYLSRTPASAGNRKTWTWSGWVKRGKLGTTQSLFARYTANTGSGLLTFIFWNDDTLRLISGSTDYRVTTAKYRDVSSWYHLVCSVDTTNATANNRIRFYVNGSEVTSFSTTNNFNQNDDTQINENVAHYIGYYLASVEFDGYLTEINFIDGQALTPSSFGETDAITGRWKAKAYSGTYGTNGFYLKFADNSGTTATTLGKDSSGNGNNWTPNNFSVTAGAGNDSLLDSPTNNGTSGNYATLNPLNAAHTYSNGNLDIVTSTTSYTSIPSAVGSIGMSSGKWYFEFTPTVLGTNFVLGITSIPSTNGYVGQTSASYGYYSLAGNKITGGVDVAYGASIAVNDVVGVAVDLDSGKIWWSKNGTWQASGNPESGTNAAYTSIPSSTYFPAISKDTSGASTVSGTFNFGQRPFAYTAPTGFKALCTTNLPTPTIQKPSSYMDVVTYTGNGSTQTISSLGFSPDLVWIKSRSGAYHHRVYDTTRGVTKVLYTSLTDAEVTVPDANDNFVSFNSNGFTLGSTASTNGLNENSQTFVSWAWYETPIAGMDIVSYTGDNNSSTTISHSLGVTPSMIIVKPRSGSYGTEGWQVWHKSLSASNVLQLHSTAAQAGTGTFTSGIISSSPTSSAFGFTAGSGGVLNVNASSTTYIAYLFAEVEGFSKFGSYTGNGSADGPFVWCGFRPRWVMIKSVMSSTNWIMFDTARSTYNQINDHLGANTSSAENFTANESIDVTANGFKVRNTNTDINYSTYTHIFAAFAESPFKYSRAR